MATQVGTKREKARLLCASESEQLRVFNIFLVCSLEWQKNLPLPTEGLEMPNLTFLDIYGEGEERARWTCSLLGHEIFHFGKGRVNLVAMQGCQITGRFFHDGPFAVMGEHLQPLFQSNPSRLIDL